MPTEEEIVEFELICDQVGVSEEERIDIVGQLSSEGAAEQYASNRSIVLPFPTAFEPET